MEISHSSIASPPSPLTVASLLSPSTTASPPSPSSIASPPFEPSTTASPPSPSSIASPPSPSTVALPPFEPTADGSVQVSPPPWLTTSLSPSKGSNTSIVGVIVGIGVGGIFLAAIFILIYCWRRKRIATRSGLEEHLHGQHPQESSDKPSGGPTSTAVGFSLSKFTYEELVMATNNFSSVNLLGEGGFGYVHKGVLQNGKLVAIKQLKAGSGQGEREFRAEVEVISRVHHRHLVSLVGYCSSGARRMLVYEFVSNSTLEFHLHGKGRPTMDWPTRMKVALGSAKGLAYLHEDCQPKIIHRDIKAANILLDHSFEAKVADFGLAKFFLDTETHVSTRIMGTVGYLAPEYESSGKLTDKSDVFSFGVVLLELITGLQPINRDQSFNDGSMVEWARPLLTEALESEKFDALVDPRLQNDYDFNEMNRMLVCAAVCVRRSAQQRPKMSQMVRALEGNISLDDLSEGGKAGHSTAYSSHGNKDYDSGQHKEDLKRFRELVLENQEQRTSYYSGLSSESGLHPSSSTTEGLQTTEEIELDKTKTHNPVSSENS